MNVVGRFLSQEVEGYFGPLRTLLPSGVQLFFYSNSKTNQKEIGLIHRYVFRIFGWEISILNLKEHERRVKEYDQMVQEWDDYWKDHDTLDCGDMRFVSGRYRKQRELEYEEYLRDIYEADMNAEKQT